MLLFAENRFIASAFFSKLTYGFGDSPLRSHLKSPFCQAAVADPLKNGGPYLNIFAHSVAVINTSMV